MSISLCSLGNTSCGGGASGATSETINGVTYGNILAKPTDPGYLIHEASASGASMRIGGAITYQDFQTPNDGDPLNYFVSVDTINTYYTLANITGASNGGFLYNIVTPATNGGNQTIRITLDGTAYTIVKYAGASARLVFGNIGYANFDNPINYIYASTNITGDQFTSSTAARVPFFSAPLVQTGSIASKGNFFKIFFSSSCKVEVQTTTISTAYSGHVPHYKKAFCSIETL